MQERVDNKKTRQNTVNLLTSTIKAGAEEEGLRHCFRVVSPEREYLLQVTLPCSDNVQMYSMHTACLLCWTLLSICMVTKRCLSWREESNTTWLYCPAACTMYSCIFTLCQCGDVTTHKHCSHSCMWKYCPASAWQCNCMSVLQPQLHVHTPPSTSIAM